MPPRTARCFECGEPARHQHHVVPRARGGTKTVPLCAQCHALAHDMSLLVLSTETRQRRKPKPKWMPHPKDVEYIWRQFEMGTDLASIALRLRYMKVLTERGDIYWRIADVRRVIKNRVDARMQKKLSVTEQAETLEGLRKPR